MLDIERFPGCQIDDAFGQLCRAGFHVRAADVLVPLFGRSKFRPAARAVRRHHETAQLVFVSFPAFQHRTYEFGNHIARLTHHNGVSDEHTLAFHFEWIVQGGSRHRRTRNIYGLQYGHWGHTAGAPHLHGDVKQFRIDFLRRVLVGDGPTRSTRGRAQRSLQSQIIHFYDNAVERVFDISTMLAVVIDHVENLAECGDLTVMWRNGYAPLLIQPIRFGLVVDRIMVGTTFGAPLERSNAMRVEAQPSGGGDARILLPQASGSRVTWIGERRAPSILVFFVERVEIVPSHEDLTADLHEFGNVFFRSRKILRNGGDGAHIERDILADHAVTSGQTLLEHAVTVDEVKRKTVDFHFACHRQRLRLRPIKSPNNTVVPFMQFLKRKDIVKTHHARRVAYRCEIIGEGASDTMRRRLRGIEGWELGFQRLQTTYSRIIGGVGRDRRVIDVVCDLVGFHPRRHTRPQSSRGFSTDGRDIKSGQPHGVGIGWLQCGDPAFTARRI